MAARRVVKRKVNTKSVTPVETPISPFAYPQWGENKGFLEKIAPVLLVVVIVMSFAVGAMWSKLKYFEGGAAPTAGTPAAVQPKIALGTIKDLFKKDVVKFGDANKKLLMVEVGDPSCPFCHVAGGHNPELSAQMGAQFKAEADGGTYVPPVTEMRKLLDSGKASFVYIYTPGHGAGEMAMKAMYCANEKGKFWEAHDLFMSNAGYELQNTTVKNDKAQSGVVADFLKNVVNPADIKACLDSGKYDARLAADTKLAGELGVNGTPGFFLNDTNFAGAYSWNDMKSVAETALK